MPRNSNTKLFSLPAGTQPADGTNADAGDVNNQVNAIISGELNTARPIEMGGTGAATAAAARTNLGLAVGSNVQAHSGKLDAIAAMAWADNRILAGAGANTIKGLTFRDRDDLGGANADASGVASEQSVKAYADAKVAGIPAASANLGLAKTSDDISFSNGAGTIRDNRVGYDELNAGTGTTGQHLVKTSGGLGFTDAPRVPSRSALAAPAASMEWTIPAGVIGIRVDGNLTRGMIGNYDTARSVSLQLGTAAAWGGSLLLNGRNYISGNYVSSWSAKPGEIWAVQDNFGESGPVTRARIVWSGTNFTSIYSGTGLRLFFF